MKKVRILGIGLVFCLALSMLALLPFNTVSASAAVNALDTMNIENVTQALFGDKQINKTEYLYNLNDSPDFVYVEFSDYGYAVYLRETAELLEYAPSGRLPFSSNKTRNYYGGPTNYFGKYSDQFIDLSTDEIFYVSNAEKQRFSQELLNIFSESSVDRANRLDITNADENGYSITNNEPIGKSPTGSDKPSLDDEGIIITPLPGSTGTHYISNAQYFLSNPRHGNNSTGTCGAVAAQLMLSYHNYYSDRRIIAEGHLNGNWNGTTNTFLTTNNLEQSPNTCTDPRTMNRNTLGSNGYNENTANTFFNVMVNAIPASATTSQVRNGMRNVLNNRNVSYSVDSHEPFLWIGPIGESGIKSEINANRPTILLLQRSLGGWDHYVVAYGYMDMVSPTNGSTYSGYITHFGHSDNSPFRLNVWVNSAWTYSYISMTVNHTHTYTSTGTVLNGSEMIRQCACGHRDVDTLFNLSGGTITGLKYSLTSSTALTIPSVINGTTITAIGNSAFANQTQLSQITIPASVTKIGWEAFSPYTVLTSYGGSLEDRADIDFVVASGTLDTYLANGWTGFNNVELSASGALSVTSGQLRGVVEVPITFNNRAITAIGSSGFANQTQITGITIMSATTIGSNAFANCTNLEDILYYSQTGLASTPNHSTSYSNYYYTERSLDISLLPDVVYTLSFDYSNLTSSTSISNVFTSLGVGENTFAVDLPVQKTFSSTSGTQVIIFTPTEAQLSSSSKLWCRFIRTSTPQSVSINISNVRLDMGVTSISSNSFTGCEKLATFALSYRLLENDTYAVEGIKSGWPGVFFLLSRTLFIPSYHNGKAVTQIDSRAFADNTMLEWAFIQSGITKIGNRAFQFCTNLKTVDLSATAVTRIEDYTFDTCSLGNFYFPSNLTYIGSGAFIRAGSVNAMPDSVSIIGSYAFFNSTISSSTKIPAAVTSIGEYAYNNAGLSSSFAFQPNSQLISIGNYAFANNNLTRIVLPSSITNIGTGAFNGNTSLTIYTQRSYTSTNPNWNGSNRPIVWGCTLSSDNSYVVSFSKTVSNPSYQSAANGITNPYRSGYNFGGWYTTSDFSGTQYMDLATAPNGILYAKWNTKSCVAEGTMITLADGSQVAVEDLTGEELLLVWNLFTGTFDVAPILFIDSDPYTEYEIIHLYFSDGTEVKVISEHGFWDIDLNKYVFLRNDAAQHIGHWFNKQTDDGDDGMIWTAVQLLDVEVYNEYTTAWSPVTFGHLCYYVNGMLSMPGATEGLINIFEVDADTMQYDATSFASDIATYGLFTYDEFADILPIPEIIFEAFNGQYLKIAMGKGLIDWERLVGLVEHYARFFVEQIL